jgi:5-methylcytosine-specific restriction endonuclease McrA
MMTAQEAAVALWKDRATLVEDWGEVFGTARGSLPVPKVIALREYVHVHAQPKFCRRSIYLRDRYCCQYCGVRFHTSELTFDHVFPRSKGGQTTWDNVLTCCVKCNVSKRDSLVSHGARRGSQQGWRPLKMPRQPTSFELLKNGIEELDPTIRSDYASYLYWTAELRA